MAWTIMQCYGVICDEVAIHISLHVNLLLQAANNKNKYEIIVYYPNLGRQYGLIVSLFCLIVKISQILELH